MKFDISAGTEKDEPHFPPKVKRIHIYADMAGDTAFLNFKIENNPREVVFGVLRPDGTATIHIDELKAEGFKVEVTN